MIARVLPILAALLAGPALDAGAAEPPAPPAPARRTADASIVRALQDHRWTLRSASDSAGQPIGALLPPDHPFVLSFDGARLVIRGGCNQMNGAWRLSPHRELSIGRLAATMKACEAVLMEADSALSAVLGQPLRVELTPAPNPELRLSTATQQTLSFRGEPTLRSLYGAPKRVFLEVAAQAVDCAPTPVAAGSCLQVRELRFDGKGLRKDPPGPWHPFAEPIEGYTHTPGVRNVLRIDRYERRPAPAGASPVRYVLDLVVESETVSPR